MFSITMHNEGKVVKIDVTCPFCLKCHVNVCSNTSITFVKMNTKESLVTFKLLQPHFWKSVRMTLTLPKWELGSPLGLPKLQSSIVGVKTPFLEAFFISLESHQSVDVKSGLT
jgi:hypothetical protein